MDPRDVLARTVQGAEALAQRGHDLPRTLRHALILVDGRSTVAELEQKGAVIPEFPAALRELVTRGLVAPRGAGAAPNEAPAPLTSTAGDGGIEEVVALAEDILGGRAEKVVRKLREAAGSREEIAAAVETSYKLIRLTIDEGKAEAFRAAARKVLAKG